MRMLLKLCTLLVTSALTFPIASHSLRIGTKRQLFVDDHLIESVAGLQRIFHKPERYAGNPILTGTEPWEKWMIELNGRPIVYDDVNRQFRMYYGAHLPEPAAPEGTRYKVCLALSEDGLHWRRPNLGLVAWEGSRSNNILPWGENWMRRPNVILDAHDPDRNKRYKMTYVDVIAGRTALTKGNSVDGIHWRLNGDGKPWFRREHSSNLLGWHGLSGQYVTDPRMAGAQDAHRALDERRFHQLDRAGTRAVARSG